MTTGSEPLTVAVIGGTGKEGRGLAHRWARAGLRVVIGSRSSDKAVAAALEIRRQFGDQVMISGASNLDAARQATVVMLTVPYDAHAEILRSIAPVMQGRLLIDATVPLQSSDPAVVHPPAAGSAAQEARQIVGPGIEVAAAFHTISYKHLLQDEDIESEVLVTGTSPEARARTLELVAAAGLKGWDAGALENSTISEGLTCLLIHINKNYGSRQAGIRISGVKHA